MNDDYRQHAPDAVADGSAETEQGIAETNVSGGAEGSAASGPADDPRLAQEGDTPITAEDGGDEAVAGPDGEADARAALADRVAQLEAELEEMRQSLLRVHADFDNYRKRTRQEMDDLRKFAARALLAELLPVADNFDRALAAFVTGNVDDIRAGVEMVRRQLAAVLEKHGVTPMECVGQAFDPTRHEAVMQEPADGREAGVVVEELQKGYMLHDKVLRPALVKVTV